MQASYVTLKSKLSNIQVSGKSFLISIGLRGTGPEEDPDADAVEPPLSIELLSKSSSSKAEAPEYSATVKKLFKKILNGAQVERTYHDHILDIQEAPHGK